MKPWRERLQIWREGGELIDSPDPEIFPVIKRPATVVWIERVGGFWLRYWKWIVGSAIIPIVGFLLSRNQ